MAPRIPLDIWFEIMDPGVTALEPSERRRTLRMLTLTSRALAGRAQRLLYRNVYFSKPDVFQRFARTVQESPSLGKLVQALQIYIIDREDKHIWNAVISHNALGRLPNLRDLTFVFDGPVPKVLRKDLTALGNRLEVLSIGNVHFPSDGDILRLLARFPKLTSLDLDGCFWHSSADPPPAANADSALVTLRSVGNWDEGTILRMMPQGIQRLTVGEPMPDNETADRRPLSFARFANLMFLELSLNFTPSDDNMGPMKALKECRLRKLEELSLQFRVGCRKVPRAQVERSVIPKLARALGTLLSSDPVPALKKLSVNLDVQLDIRDRPTSDPYVVLEHKAKEELDRVLRKHKPSGVALTVIVEPSLATLEADRYFSAGTGAA
ncbi:hypothetical protein BD413DRAFT_613621 [Trametes elegans]|nr:hypothetical protein BD413DRAFT_613621 [Trametes elegans]